MKKIISAAVLATAMFLLTGCPYESDVPVDHPSIPISKKLLGSFEERKSHDVYVVTMKDQMTYRIVKDKDTLSAFVSLVDGITFLNLWDESVTARKYSLYKLDMDFNLNLELSEVTENITEKFSTTNELKKFISANMNNSYFFGKEKISLTRLGN